MNGVLISPVQISLRTVRSERPTSSSILRAITIIDNGLIKIIDGNFRSRSKYRWPLLSSAGCDRGPAGSDLFFSCFLQGLRRVRPHRLL